MAKKQREEIEEQKPEKPRETTVEFLASLASVLVTGLFIITFILQAFEIPSGSMENTLLIGDHLFVNREQFAPRTKWMGKLMPYRDIRRDEIVVFLSPEQPGLFLVKRIIGIPGDRIHLRDGVVYRNGQKLDEPFVIHKPDRASPYTDNFPALPPSESFGVRNDKWREDFASHIDGEDLVVAPNTYFAMGDNRDESYDSRFWGLIPQANIIGRPMFIYWSFETPRDQYDKRDWSDRIIFVGKIILHFFDRTIWSRTFKVVR